MTELVGPRTHPTRTIMKSQNQQNSYVEQRDQGYWVAGTRVSLDSIVYAFFNGQTAESIAQSFPALALEQV